VIPPAVERRARWVLDSIGAHDVRLGPDLPYAREAWHQVDRGERPRGDEVAEAFFHLARVEERRGARDGHGRFRASASCLDPLDPPLERLRSRLGLEPRRWAGARFAVALTHDVDIPWRWTRIGVRGAAARLKEHGRMRRAGPALREARALAEVPLHKLRGSDPNWSFDRVFELEREREAPSTFFLLGAYRHPADGPAPETYARLRPRLVETVRAGGGEIGLHGSYTAADDADVLAEEKRTLEALAGPVRGHRYHFLRVRPDVNIAPLERLGFAYDTSLGFADSPGFRAGIAQPFRPWDADGQRPLDLVEIPLAVMDATFDDRYLGLSARAAEPHVMRLVEWAAEHGGAFAVLWHTDRFDRGTAGGWDRLFARLLDAVVEHGGACVSAGELAEEARRCSR
jgi:peptidoglycan/xylan/chitin deacetylase (PgdA/CDA1 family)